MTPLEPDRRSSALLEDLPDLRIVVSHGGGYLPHYYGRLDRNVHNMPDSTVHISQPPSAYLQRLYYDTCVYEPLTLSALTRQVGAGRLLMGSDWPVGEADPIGFVKRCPELADPADRAAVARRDCGGPARVGVTVSRSAATRAAARRHPAAA